MDTPNPFTTLRTAAAFHALHDAEPFTIRCAWCTALILAGGPVISHGMCPSCAATFEHTPDVSDVERTPEAA